MNNDNEWWYRSEIHTNAALKNDQWRRPIAEGAEYEMKSKNWEFRRKKAKQKRYETKGFIKSKRILYFVIFFSAFIACEGQDYIEIFQPNWSSSAWLITLYYFCYIWIEICLYAVPLGFFYYIYRNVYILDDVIGLKKEVKDIAIKYFFISMLQIIYEVTWSVIKITGSDLINYWPIIFVIFEILIRILYIPINFKQTGWVINKFTGRFTDEMQMSRKASSTIYLSTREMRNRAHEETIYLLEMRKESITLHEDDEKELLEMQRTLKDYIAFNQFMRYSIKVFVAIHHIYRGTCVSSI